jgi:hypothetical protein
MSRASIILLVIAGMSAGLVAVTAVNGASGPIDSLTVDPDLAGKSAVIVLVTVATPTNEQQHESLSGKIAQSTTQGVWLKATERLVIVSGQRESQAFAADLFLPWSSIRYIELK